MTGIETTNTAVALMCWDNGGQRLVGLMVVRRADGHACFVEMPADIEKRLAVIDVKFVEENAAQLLTIAYECLTACEFEADRVVSSDLLQQGYQPAVPGTMRHIPAELIARNPSGIATWQAAGFVVNVGEIDLALYRQHRTVHWYLCTDVLTGRRSGFSGGASPVVSGHPGVVRKSPKSAAPKRLRRLHREA